MQKRVIVHLAEGFEEIEAITIIDVLRRAGAVVTVLSISGSRKVTGAHQISVEADDHFDERYYADADMLVLPGGMPGTRNLLEHAGLRKVLPAFYASGRRVAAICAAPIVLAGLSLLNGKKAVCYPGFEGELSASTLVDQPFVTDGLITTGKGVGGALLFSLELVRLLFDSETAGNLKKALVID